MKKLGLVMLIATLWFMSPTSTSAQVSVNFNVSSQPLWGPVSYDYVEYYYMPEYNMYYYAPRGQYVYLNGSNWVFSTSLPYQYRHANLYSTYKVVINEPRPYMRNAYYSNHYKGYKNSHSRQGSIRDSRDQRYSGIKNHPTNPNYHQGNKPYNRNMAQPAHNQNYKGTPQHNGGNNNQIRQNNKSTKNQSHQNNQGKQGSKGKNNGGGNKHGK
jgi:hypothetical protein